jgi:hypothetical protein
MRVIGLLLTLAGGCVTTVNDVRATFVAADVFASGAWDLARPYYQQKCMASVDACLAAKDAVCKPKDMCQAERRAIGDKINRVHAIAREGLVALEAAEASKDKSLSKRAQTLVATLAACRADLIDAMKGSPLWTEISKVPLP